MKTEIFPPFHDAPSFNFFQAINFKTFQALPRFHKYDPDPILGKSIYKPPESMAWHSRYKTVFPHSLEYMALRNITTGDIEQLLPILNNPHFNINSIIDKKYKLTPLQFAAFVNQYPIVQLLIMHGANINQQDSEGNTALMLAVRKESLESINSLMKNGCDRNLTNQYQVSAIDKAKEQGSHFIAQFISQYPSTSRRFPKFHINLDIDKKINNNPIWQFIKNYPLYSGKPKISPFNNFKGDYNILLTENQTVQQNLNSIP